MTKYKVKVTPQATAQMRAAVAYISHTLLEPNTARRWANALQKGIASLDSMPGRYPLTREEPWQTNGVHRMPFKNFLVYYLIDDEEKVVTVTAVIYGRRDQLSALRNMQME